VSVLTRIWVYRILLSAIVLTVWQVLGANSVSIRFFIGSPLGVLHQIIVWFASGTIYRHLAITLTETLLAFVIATVLALTVGLFLALNSMWSAVCDPFIKAMNTMPRLILAPIFAVWFGLGIWSKVALAVTIVFFVVFFNVFQGIREVSPILLANVRMLGASPSQLVRRVYLPSAMTWVFSSLHLSIGMAFIGAVIGEYLGSSAGVGYLILQAESVFDINAVIAGIAVLTACALVLDGIVSVVETKLLVWKLA
jgi:NitT/TauT family transport system permease protein